ncbi:membrane-targeted effector domain-containing toxin [Pseudomonas sp. B21-053]|uniref:membrane-targeted effector domain-containing toxin n=1 Tax=Pseudomonas sp. B21-053 TaxID=2895493 RepID=UPI0022318D4D|nr:membrane-targeted effector domain-containing toxin [Pseudomonas sp. B21-053]UZE10885.1 membrane-targeted effector domain-containing toxin [Pseudomonas sp. B21-053]
MTVNETPSDLPNAADAQALKALVPALVEACPDLYDMATTFAKRILTDHGILTLEPDQVYWHRFHGSQSNDKTFTGWEHIEHPHDSMTLTQLVIQRFSVHDQDNADMLDNDCGFYTAGPEVGTYNETNEVRLFGSEVLKAFWAYNFIDQYKAKVETFWNTQRQTFRTLAKCTFLAKATEDYEAGRLTADHLRIVIKACAGTVNWPATQHMLEAEFQPSKNLRIRRLCVGSFVSTDILCIVDGDNRQIVYVPGELWGFHVFDSVEDLHWWILSAIESPSGRQRFLSHFQAADHDIMEDTAQYDKTTEWVLAPFPAIDLLAHLFREPKIENVGLNSVLDLLFNAWKHNDHQLLADQGAFIEQDPFTYLRDATHARMLSDATFMMTSNGELRKKLWMGYLNAFGRMFGPLAAVGWPVALAVVGAGLANVGLNIDQAVNGKTSTERKAGVTGAIFAAIDTLFNAMFLKGGGVPEIAEADDLLASEGKISKAPLEPIAASPLEELVPERFPSMDQEDYLTSFRDEITEPTQEGIGAAQGIIETLSGKKYIFMQVGTQKYYYQVRYVGQMKCWVIIDPANPWSFYRNIPVRLDEYLQWEPVKPLGLKGGVGGKIFGLKLWGQTPEPLPQVETPPTPYDMPENLRPGIRTAGNGSSTFDNIDNSLEAFSRYRQLQADASTFFADIQLPARPKIPTFSTLATPKEILKGLLKDARGLVIGEGRGSMASKQFLIENMPLLSKLKVRTLYLQQVLTDFQQADLNTFTRTGNMSESLEHYLNEIDQVEREDPSGQFTFLELAKTAQKNHIRIQAIDCFASYREAGPSVIKDHFDVQMKNYFARTVIDADQAARGAHQWVALVRESNASSLDGVAGLSELEGAVGMRIEEVPAGKARGIEADPGKTIEHEGTALALRSDLRLQMDTPSVVSSMRRADTFLTENGMFTLLNEQVPVLVNRNRNGVLMRTPIYKENGGYRVDNANWGTVNGRHFRTLEGLRDALIARGMRLVRIPAEDSTELAAPAPAKPGPSIRPPQTPNKIQPELGFPYEISPSRRPEMKNWVLKTEEQRGQALAGESDPDTTINTSKLTELRGKLRIDSQHLPDDLQLKRSPERPQVPTQNATAIDFITKVFSEAKGLVIGESPERIASNRFLIENMPQFAREGVEALYMPRLLSDFNQADLDFYFASRAGAMPHDLESYLKIISADQETPFTYLEVVMRAKQNGIRIQAIDCAASYTLSTPRFPSVEEQRLSNYFATQIIQADQVSRPGKWLALTAPENTNTFRNVAGLSERNGGIGLRIEETGPGEGVEVRLDPGVEVHRIAAAEPMFRGQFDTLYVDMYLPMETPMLVRTAAQRERLLYNPGFFCIERSGETNTLWHRSRTDGIVSTPIERLADGRYSISRPNWPTISQIPYANLFDLFAALSNHGLRGVGRIPG